VKKPVRQRTPFGPTTRAGALMDCEPGPAAIATRFRAVDPGTRTRSHPHQIRVEYTLPAIGNILRDLGLSPHRPLVHAYEQNPERVRRWKEEEYPAIHATAKAAGGSIIFCDEAGVRTDYHSGTTWAPVGQRPIVQGTGNRKSVNMISAISPRGRLHFSFADGNVNAANFIEYLKKLIMISLGRSS
jgi:DDE superfamily endonuclease/winged helix-turn-helix protein